MTEEQEGHRVKKLDPATYALFKAIKSNRALRIEVETDDYRVTKFNAMPAKVMREVAVHEIHKPEKIGS